MSELGREKAAAGARVLVTGASGFVGGSLVRRLAARGIAVTGVSRRSGGALPVACCSTTYGEDEVAALVDELTPTTIIHAAGSASVAASIDDPAQDFASQVLLFQRLLEGVRRSRHRPRVVFLSSAAVYGNPERLPVAEGAPPRPISPYGYHKLLAELLAREYAESLGVPTLVVRLFSLFGAAQRRLLLWELFEQLRDRAEVVVDGTGEEARDYLHVDDLADALVRLLPKVDATTLTINVASGSSITVRELVTRMAALMQTQKPTVFRGRTRPGNPARWQADVSLFERLVGATSTVAFEERLARTLEEWRA